MVVFEDYATGFRKTTGRLAHLGEVGGALKFTAWEAGTDILVAPPAVMKSLVANNGGAKKDAVQAAIRKLYGYHVTQDDEADALGLMLVGEHLCGSDEINPTPARRASLDKCEMTRNRYAGLRALSKA